MVSFMVLLAVLATGLLQDFQAGKPHDLTARTWLGVGLILSGSIYGLLVAVRSARVVMADAGLLQDLSPIQRIRCLKYIKGGEAAPEPDSEAARRVARGCRGKPGTCSSPLLGCSLMTGLILLCGPNALDVISGIALTLMLAWLLNMNRRRMQSARTYLERARPDPAM